MNSIDLPLVKPRDILCLAPFSLPHNFLISIKSSIITLPYIFLNPCFFYRFLSAFENFRTLRTLLSSSLRLHFPRKLSNIASVFSPPLRLRFPTKLWNAALLLEVGGGGDALLPCAASQVRGSKIRGEESYNGRSRVLRKVLRGKFLGKTDKLCLSFLPLLSLLVIKEKRYGVNGIK